MTTHALSQDLQHLVDDGQPVSPDCPHCEGRISGETVAYGGELLHRECHELFGREMAMAFPDELAPIDPEAFDFLDPDWCQPEDETIYLTLEEQE
jgi:hypothetical protein